MKNQVKNIVAYASLFTGLLVTLLVVREYASNDSIPVPLNPVSLPLLAADHGLVTDVDFSSSSSENYLVIMILGDNVCPPCMSEVHEYFEVINSSDYSMTPIIAITGDHSTAQRQIKISDWPAAPTYVESEQIDPLLDILDMLPPVQLFVDAKSGLIRFYGPLSANKLTSMAFKRLILDFVDQQWADSVAVD